MTSRVGRTLYLEPRNILPLPMIVSHREWCAWLSTHNSLAASHRACLHADSCVAVLGYAVHEPDSWERHRVSR